MLALALLLIAADAERDDADTWEDARLDEVLASEHLVRFSPSDSDRIEFVDIERHDVFTPDDPWPDIFNVVHVMTAEDVVARELLFAEGEPFDQARLDETARNLRDMFIFAFVRVVPVKRTTTGDSGVLVFTRDLWSLRFEQGFQVTGTSIDRLLLQLTERNVAGRAKVASARFTLDPSSWALGETYIDPRVWGGDIAATESVDVLFSRATGAFDGSAGAFFVGMPLLNLEQPWGFDVIAKYDIRTIRQIQNGAVISFDAPSTLDVETIPRVWGQREIDVETAATRQFHALMAHRITAGIGFSDHAYEPIAETQLPSELTPDFAAEVLPVSRRTLGPFIALHSFTSRHRIYEDLDTYGVSEAVRLGPTVAVVMGTGSKALLSSSDTLFGTGAVGIALDPLGGLFEAATEASARWEDGDIVNRVLSARLRYATPPTFAGRFCLRADTTFRRNDITNVLVTLGGDNGLRGYESQAFFDFGASSAIATLEWRSLPIDLWSVHVGVAAFYDVGTIYQELDDAQFHHSVGVGIRFLFPQLNRGVYRLDLAAPLDELGFRVLFSIGDTQAVQHAEPAFARLVPRK